MSGSPGTNRSGRAVARAAPGSASTPVVTVWPSTSRMARGRARSRGAVAAGAEILTQDHPSEQGEEGDRVGGEHAHVDPPRDRAVPGERAALEDPCGGDDHFRERVAEIQVAEPLRE